MTALSIGSDAVTRCDITFPQVGVWCADVDLDTETAPTGRVTLVVDGVPTWSGTVIAGGVSHGLWSGRIVGGAGGLRAELPARAYGAATLADVVRDILAETGEQLAASAASLSASAPLWHRSTGPAARALAFVAATAGYVWRVLADGTVWLGLDAWQDAGDRDVTLIGQDSRRGLYTLVGDTLALQPGQLLQVQDEASADFVQLARVRHVFGPDDVTTTVWQS